MTVDKEILQEGDKVTYPKKGDTLTMHYLGTLRSNGKKFDSSYDRNRPFQFVIGVGQVIQGWDEGVITMSLGEKAKLTISSDWAYGDDSPCADIPPNSDLVFEVQLLAINGTKASSSSGCCAV
eukprot:TRINITY_DN607_c0_g1_i1.p1 TRINITY_DN607_c0_g1~~TRINITY_DN607_c0_g1_i1.p1  ORF type:complete len:141 (-),score=59.31 TRINITY_DN607_c0_g1_i1:55-423(-)